MGARGRPCVGRWKKNATEFRVGLFYDERRGCMMTVPKPVLEEMGRPESVLFTVKRGRITVEAGN